TRSAVDPDYFATLRIPLVAGRSFSAADRAGTQPVVIVSETAARYLWPGQDAVGNSLLWHEAGTNGREAITTLRVIGVARDLRPPVGAATRDRVQFRGEGQQLIASQPAPSMLMMYVPLRQRYTPRFTILARSTGGNPIASDIRDLVK